MEYLFGIPTKISDEYLIMENDFGEGRRIWILPHEEYSINLRQRIYTHTVQKLENNTINTRTYGFLRESDCLLFSLLLQIKGIGPKTSQDMVARSAGKIVKHILEDNLMALMSLPGVYRYGKEIMDYFRKPKNKSLLEQLNPDCSEKFSKKSEILEIMGEMGIDVDRAKKTLETLDNYESLDTGVLIGKVMERMEDGK